MVMLRLSRTPHTVWKVKSHSYFCYFTYWRKRFLFFSIQSIFAINFCTIQIYWCEAEWAAKCNKVLLCINVGFCLDLIRKFIMTFLCAVFIVTTTHSIPFQVSIKVKIKTPPIQSIPYSEMVLLSITNIKPHKLLIIHAGHINFSLHMHIDKPSKRNRFYLSMKTVVYWNTIVYFDIDWNLNAVVSVGELLF